MTQPPQSLLELLARFQRNRDAYTDPGYNETQVRREFIDPLFKALGWDVDNESGVAEAYKDVIHEDAIKIGGATKAPDYCFRIGGTRKFFVEAKKPAVGVSTDPEPAYQLRRYAWTSKLPLSVLTDFEEFAVYDCRIRPSPSDKAATARVFYCRFDEYPSNWEWIAGHFSKDAVLKGAFDRYAESNRRKRGTAEVDAEFLKEIELWRESLAQNFALRNSALDVRELNFAVQRTIDRIIFLRMCEDRGIEPYGQLLGLVNGPAVYSRLGELFRRADERYNSSLFYFTAERGREPPDDVTLALQLDDKALKDILKALYYPDSPYEFSVLPTEILGYVYEQFLGKVIRLTTGHRAKVEEKPEVRKAGGVYYTPTYIVDYIVKHTVGKLLEERVPGLGAWGLGDKLHGDQALSGSGSVAESDGPVPGRRAAPERAHRRPAKKGTRDPGPEPLAPISRLRILDPACGSGSFLLGAYQYLLDWHRDWYVAQIRDPGLGTRGQGLGARDSGSGPQPPIPQPRTPSPEPRNPYSDRIYQGNGGQWRLTIQEKKRILLNNIYGVDIDPQAVETTKLSLLLKVLEGETSETIGRTLRLFHERALPDLDRNIKCGNSLIGPDFYDGQQMSLFDDDERLRINAFDWHAEFPEVFGSRASGPGSRAPSPGPQPPGSGPRAPGPASGFDAVIGNPPYGASFGDDERTYVNAHFQCCTASPDSYIAFLEMGLRLLADQGRLGMIVPSALFGGPSYVAARRHLLAHAAWDRAVLLPYDVFSGAYIDTCIVCLRRTDAVPPGHRVQTFEFAKRDKLPDMSDLAYKSVAQEAWRNDSEHRIVVDPTAVQLLRVLHGRFAGKLSDVIEIKRGVLPTPNALSTRRTATRRHRYFDGDVYRYVLNPSFRYFVAFDDSLKERPREFRWFTGPRILLRRLVSRRFRLMASIASDEFITNKNLYTILPRPGTRLEVILGILNSRLFSYLYAKQVTQATKDDFAQVTIKDVGALPWAPPTQAVEHRFVDLVERVLTLHTRLPAIKIAHHRTALERQIDATDRQIDQLVYELYGLTDDEIRIVEEAIHP